jgi:hypothetical protein
VGCVVIFNRALPAIKMGWLAILLVLASCQPNSTVKDLDEYHSRLIRLLDNQQSALSAIEFDQLLLNQRLRYPSRKQLIQYTPVDANKAIELRTFYQLTPCAAHRLIAQRNTQLGKVQLPSQRFIYESQLLDAFDKCIKQTNQISEQRFWQELKSQKQQVFAQVWANMLQQSEEIKQAFASPQRLNRPVSQQGLAEVKSGFQHIMQLSNATDPELMTKRAQLEANLKRLGEAALPAKAWNQQAVLIAGLTAMTDQLKPVLTGLACEKPRQRQQLSYAGNVLVLYFVQRIQTQAAQINQIQYQLQSVYQALIDNTRLHPAFRQMIDFHGITQANTLRQVLTEHSQLWSDTFQRCGLSLDTIAKPVA